MQNIGDTKNSAEPTALELESYQDYDVTCSVMKVGYAFLDNKNPAFLSKTAKEIPASANVEVTLRQQVRSTNFKLQEKKAAKKEQNQETAPSETASEGENSTASSQEQDKLSDSLAAAGENVRSSDYKSEDEQLEVVQQIVEENIIKEGATAADQAQRADQAAQETGAWVLSFKDKIGEIKSKDEEPLHVFKQNVRFYQDRETNTFNPRMIEFSIQIKGDHAKKIKKEDGKPNQEIFHFNYLNLCQYLRKRELSSEVEIGDHEFHLKELLEQKAKEEEEKRIKEEEERKIREAEELKLKEEMEKKAKEEEAKRLAEEEAKRLKEEEEKKKKEEEEAKRLKEEEEKKKKEEEEAQKKKEEEEAKKKKEEEEAQKLKEEEERKLKEKQEAEAAAAAAAAEAEAEAKRLQEEKEKKEKEEEEKKKKEEEEKAKAEAAAAEAAKKEAEAAAAEAAKKEAEATDDNKKDDDEQNEGGESDVDSLEGATEEALAPMKIRLFFRKDGRCELNLPKEVDSIGFVYVDVDFNFKRTQSKQFTKYEPLLLKKLKQSDQDVTNKDVQIQILKDIVQKDHDLGRLTSQQALLALKKDKKIRRRILKIAGAKLGGHMTLSAALKGLGIEMSAKELENEEADEYKDSAEYKFLKSQQYTRDRIIDHLMKQQAQLSSVKETLEYEVLQKQIETKTLNIEDLDDYQKGLMKQIEERIEEKKKEEEFLKELAQKERTRWLEDNLDFEFSQFAFYFQD